MTVLALDIGGTKIAAVSGGRSARALAPATGQGAFDALLGLADAVVDEPVSAVGISFAGPVGADGHIHSHHTPGWDDIPLSQALAEKFGGVPVVIENDANAGALGEWDIAGRPDEPVAYITVRVGVGAGIVSHGEILAGAHRLAGELGHFVVDPDGEQCACGKRGCVETFTSGPAIARHGGTGAAYQEAARALLVAIDALTAIVDPLFVAVGGEVASAPALWQLLGARAVRARSTPLRGAEILAERAAAA